MTDHADIARDIQLNALESRLVNDQMGMLATIDALVQRLNTLDRHNDALVDLLTSVTLRMHAVESIVFGEKCPLAARTTDTTDATRTAEDNADTTDIINMTKTQKDRNNDTESVRSESVRSESVRSESVRGASAEDVKKGVELGVERGVAKGVQHGVERAVRKSVEQAVNIIKSSLPKPQALPSPHISNFQAN